MTIPLQILSLVVAAVLILTQGFANATLSGKASTLAPYECTDEDGDEKCDEPPED